MTRHCWPRKMYYVSLKSWRKRNDCHSNFIATSSLARARMLNAKLPVKRRQIDVRERGNHKPYVLEGSWR